MKTHLSSKESWTRGLDVDVGDVGEVGEHQEEGDHPAERQQHSGSGSRMSWEEKLAIPET